jgi:hypothetical protein
MFTSKILRNFPKTIFKDPHEAVMTAWNHVRSVDHFDTCTYPKVRKFGNLPIP